MLLSKTYTQAFGLICILSLSLVGCVDDKASGPSKGTQKVEKPSSKTTSLPASENQEISTTSQVKDTVESPLNSTENKPQELVVHNSSKSDQETVKSTAKKTVSQKKKKARKRLKPNLEFDLIRHNFDTIVSGDIIDYKFEFANTGKGPLVIESAKATCGCTQPSYPFIPIEPGERGYIGVTYNSVGKEGVQKPLITVRSNASKEPIALMLTGFVEPKKKTDKVQKEVAPDSLSKG